MGNDAPITDLLHLLQAGNENATTDVYGHFIDTARRMAKARLSKKLTSRIGPSTIAHEALEKCIDHAKKESPLESRDDFQRMITKHIRMRLDDAGKRELAQKRDVRKDVSDNELQEADGKSSQPDGKALADELAVQIVQGIFKEQDEIKRTIALLAILLEYSTGMIQEMVFPNRDSQATTKKESKDKKQPSSLSYIRLVIKESKNRLQREMKDDE